MARDLGQPCAIFVLKLIDTINDADEARDVCHAAGIPIDLWKSDKYNAGQVKKAFFKAVRLVHPDKIASDATLEQKVKATKIFSELSLAQASS